MRYLSIILAATAALALGACQHQTTYKPLDTGAHIKTTYPK